MPLRPPTRLPSSSPRSRPSSARWCLASQTPTRNPSWIASLPFIPPLRVWFLRHLAMYPRSTTPRHLSLLHSPLQPRRSWLVVLRRLRQILVSRPSLSNSRPPLPACTRAPPLESLAQPLRLPLRRIRPSARMPMAAPATPTPRRALCPRPPPVLPPPCPSCSTAPQLVWSKPLPAPSRLCILTPVQPRALSPPLCHLLLALLRPLFPLPRAALSTVHPQVASRVLNRGSALLLRAPGSVCLVQLPPFLLERARL